MYGPTVLKGIPAISADARQCDEKLHILFFTIYREINSPSQPELLHMSPGEAEGLITV